MEMGRRDTGRRSVTIYQNKMIDNSAYILKNKITCKEIVCIFTYIKTFAHPVYPVFLAYALSD